MFYACHSAIETKEEEWYIDSGCSNHMTSNETIFHELDTSIKTKVKMGNGELVEAKGKGTIVIDTKKGTRYIRNVLLVPRLAQNLLSVGQMMESGYALHFEKNSCRIYDKKNNQEIAEVKMGNNRNFPIQWQYPQKAMLAQLSDTSLWHRRFGHFNLNALRLLHQKKMMRDMPPLDEKEGLCEGCMVGKQHRQPFPIEKTWRAKQILELVHTDVCGPMRTPSVSKNRYFILFIDDYSRMTWVYFFQEKSEVFRIFKRFKNFVEKQSGHQIKKLRSDRGTEYNSKEFDQFCEDEGMKHQLTVAYTPQQNGVSERKNRTVMEMARSMLAEKGMPKMFWAEAVYTSVYLLNRCPTKAVLNKTPIEAWSGRKPSAKHLKVFGSICYIHVPSVKRHTLEDKAEKGIFLGYSSKSKGYRIYNFETKKLVTSRDVEFDEQASWNWETERVERKATTTQIEEIPEEEDHDQ
ncbi:unnamed protein product [Cuscuta epithymum]|uniref:Integrase catalytic domain-containing protein n=1 Tax=Cuscuta epithymum TaxID=186058 RepID=A0AAV0FGF1_9ASTE|nr:unnamed protein product [Cuscuta epithymum]